MLDEWQAWECRDEYIPNSAGLTQADSTSSRPCQRHIHSSFCSLWWAVAEGRDTGGSSSSSDCERREKRMAFWWQSLVLLAVIQPVLVWSTAGRITAMSRCHWLFRHNGNHRPVTDPVLCDVTVIRCHWYSVQCLGPCVSLALLLVMCL